MIKMVDPEFSLQEAEIVTFKNESKLSSHKNNSTRIMISKQLLDLDFVHNFWSSPEVVGQKEFGRCQSLTTKGPCSCREALIMERLIAERSVVLRPGASSI